ncbi:hypothetical protein EJ05DRAFT_539540 [Pseudovirgaria hyperparasitica]|uniref:Fe2OG dioxygenase domain-containing protein n=1 Tax=Pseudovirgaria hyperparasitica TaxID=470096 RepID=A0A6A6W4Z1_9PEZI|nr:uncharacterized protein EJ05DRAFT_539540 [Pseudovirgaria hyperparasitica]KAF2756627.1 hypothetical protein EJ05DRAFT_539540 [Pseudovirgaria hyperparasitica]
MSKKHTLDGFFQPAVQAKKIRLTASSETSNHDTYPYSVPKLPPEITEILSFSPADEGKLINDKPDLDLYYFSPYVSKDIEKELFSFLRENLFFYRVQYSIKRGPVETQINTPRYTTVFGVDESSTFGAEGHLLDAQSGKPVPRDRYKCRPRPIPDCLETLRKITEGTTGEKFNFCLVNYYASGNDSISYHSDDERFLGPNPAIASFSFGVKRDFLMKHKPAKKDGKQIEIDSKPIRFELKSGDMILMRGPTQSNWLHSIPKRKGGDVDKGRINITFRRAMVRGGTDNYYQYNVGTGIAFRWDAVKKDMVPWKHDSHS